eukprot:gene4300-6096_t
MSFRKAVSKLAPAAVGLAVIPNNNNGVVTSAEPNVPSHNGYQNESSNSNFNNIHTVVKDADIGEDYVVHFPASDAESNINEGCLVDNNSNPNFKKDKKASSIVRATLGNLSQEIILKLSESPPSKTDRAAVVKTVFEKAQSILPNHFQLEHLNLDNPQTKKNSMQAVNDAFEEILAALFEENAIDSARNNIAQAEMEYEINKKWEELKEVFPLCMKCDDVLASPFALTCGHNVCGGCLSDEFESVSILPGNGGDTYVAHFCQAPNCNHEINFKAAIFEADLSSKINDHVNGIGECESKELWLLRNRKFQHPQTPANENNNNNDNNDNNQNAENEGFKLPQWAVVLLTVAAILLVVVIRKH